MPATSPSSTVWKDAARAGALAAAFEVYLKEMTTLLQGIAILQELTPRTMDAICSFGERFSSRIVAAGLQERGIDAVWVDAKDFMLTDGNFGRALPVTDAVTARLKQSVVPLLERAQVPVTQGFIGVTAAGAYTTMGRESSDYSASIIGAALDADRVQIWTDVDGMLTADPRLVEGVRKIRHMSFEEAFELSYFGAKVLHPNTMLPLMEKNIPVEIRNSRREEGTGTIIDRARPGADGDPVVKSVSFSDDVTVICVSPHRRTNQYLFWEGVFSVLSRSGIDVRSVTTSEFRIAFTVTAPFERSPASCPSLRNSGRSRPLAGKSQPLPRRDRTQRLCRLRGACLRGAGRYPGSADRVRRLRVEHDDCRGQAVSPGCTRPPAHGVFRSCPRPRGHSMSRSTDNIPAGIAALREKRPPGSR